MAPRRKQDRDQIVTTGPETDLLNNINMPLTCTLAIGYRWGR